MPTHGSDSTWLEHLKLFQPRPHYNTFPFFFNHQGLNPVEIGEINVFLSPTSNIITITIHPICVISGYIGGVNLDVGCFEFCMSGVSTLLRTIGSTSLCLSYLLSPSRVFVATGPGVGRKGWVDGCMTYENPYISRDIMGRYSKTPRRWHQKKEI